MAKKHKHHHVKHAKQATKKAMKAMRKHKPFTAAVFALGSLASAIFRADKLRTGMEDLLGAALSRAAKALRGKAAKVAHAH